MGGKLGALHQADRQRATKRVSTARGKADLIQQVLLWPRPCSNCHTTIEDTAWIRTRRVRSVTGPEKVWIEYLCERCADRVWGKA